MYFTYLLNGALTIICSTYAYADSLVIGEFTEIQQNSEYAYKKI